MSERFEDIIRKKLNETEPVPGDNFWDKLERELDERHFQGLVQEKLENAQISEPSDRVWAGIESTLHPASGFRFIPFHYLAAAATVLLVLGLSFWFVSKDRLVNPDLSNPSVSEARENHQSPNDTLPKVNEAPRTFAQNPVEEGSPQTKHRVQTIPAKQDLTPHPLDVLPQVANAAPEQTNTDSVTPFALEDLLYAQIPDTLNAPVVLEKGMDAQPIPIQVPEPMAALKEKSGFEIAVNYIFSNIFGLPKASVALDQVKKGERNMWKVNFESRLLSFSGNLTFGKTTDL